MVKHLNYITKGVIVDKDLIEQLDDIYINSALLGLVTFEDNDYLAKVESIHTDHTGMYVSWSFEENNKVKDEVYNSISKSKD